MTILNVYIDWFLVLNATFSNISAISFTVTSFSGGRSRSTRREPLTMGKQLVNIITCGCESSAHFFCNLQSRVWTHTVLVIGLYELLGNPTTKLIEPPGLNINVCPIPVKTDVGQVDLVSRLSDGTSEKMTVLPFEGYFLW